MSQMCSCSLVHSCLIQVYTHPHLGVRNTVDEVVLECRGFSCCLPLQVFPSLARENPSLQAHIKDDGVLTHWCVQLPLFTAHSSSSVYRQKVEGDSTCITIIVAIAIVFLTTATSAISGQFETIQT